MLRGWFPRLLRNNKSILVYARCMSRTNIELDDELVAEAMRRYRLKTKREVVDLALRRLVGPRLTPADLDAVYGIGWDANLEELRNDRIAQW